MGAAGGVSRWTRAFVAASAASLVAVQTVAAAGADRYLLATVVLFGFVCPMVFGMAYLLVPSVVGRTLAGGRLPGVHFVLTYLGAGLLVADRAVSQEVLPDVAGVSPRAAGAALWSAGVAVFLALLARTVIPAVRADPETVRRSDERPQRSTRLATAAIPVALAALAAGTVVLLAWAGVVPAVAALPATFPAVVHLYGAGFAALLVFAFGARLMPGFFHVTPPRWPTRIVIVAGATGPWLLAGDLWGGRQFRVGAALVAVAMVGYAAVVAVVFVRSEWRRVGFYGVLAGAALGVGAVALALVVAVDGGTAAHLDAHATLVTGFFALTIAGYAFQFFPVTTSVVPGATERGAFATLAALAGGSLLAGSGHLATAPLVARGGAAVGLVGAAGYASLVGARLVLD